MTRCWVGGLSGRLETEYKVRALRLRISGKRGKKN